MTARPRITDVKWLGRLQGKVRPDEAALPFLAALLQSLEREGVIHASSEPLERLAAQLSDKDTARLLRRYAALRYGDAGDADALAKDMLTRPSRGRSPPETRL